MTLPSHLPAVQVWPPQAAAGQPGSRPAGAAVPGSRLPRRCTHLPPPPPWPCQLRGGGDGRLHVMPGRRVRGCHGGWKTGKMLGDKKLLCHTVATAGRTQGFSRGEACLVHGFDPAAVPAPCWYMCFPARLACPAGWPAVPEPQHTHCPQQRAAVMTPLVVQVRFLRGGGGGSPGCGSMHSAGRWGGGEVQCGGGPAAVPLWVPQQIHRTHPGRYAGNECSGMAAW